MKTLYLILLLLLFYSCSQQNVSDNNPEEFENSTISNDISNQKINVFAEDAFGHIWLGTFRGLNKYNVHEYHQYFCTDDSLGLPDNQIKDLLRDSKGRLWVATVNGVCLYTDRDNFQRIKVVTNNYNCSQLLENKHGRIFMSNITQLFEYNVEKNQFDCVIGNVDQNTFVGRAHIDLSDNLWTVNPKSLRCYDSSNMNLVDSIPINGYPTYSFMQSNGDLWLTGNHSISIFDTRTKKMKPLPEVISNNSVLRNANVEYIYPYESKGLLLVTSRQGVFYYNFVEGKLISQYENGFPFEVPRFKISTMFTDSQKNLWIGSVDQGFVVRYSYKERFNTNNDLRTLMENKSVIALNVDKSERLWISTLLDGLYMYNLNNHKSVKIDLDVVDSKEDRPEVNYIFADADNNLWMIIDNYKVVKCRYNGEKLIVDNSYPIIFARYITQDNKGTIWVAAGTNQIFGLKRGYKEFTALSLYDPSFTFIPCLLPLNSGELIVTAFYNPLKTVNSDTWEIETVKFQDGEMEKCISRSVFIPTVMYQDSQDNIWIGTITNGLMLFNPSTGRINPVKGAPCSDISAIEEDVQGNMWISTLYGLCKYDKTINKFTNYYSADGTGGNQYYERASCRLKDGTIVFGGTHGLTFFNPIDVQMKRKIPLLFEDLKIHNELIRPYDDKYECIDKHLSYKPDIRLNHSQNSFAISFAALDYCEHERVHYYYKLEGFDNFWIDAHNNREAYYANLPSGEYIFKVKITNNDKSIVEAENSIQVIVSPAPWNSWWAYVLYLILLVAIFYIFIKLREKVRFEKATAHQAELDKLQEQRINRMNMSFFANISHEFRTPLTMIYGPITQLCNNSSIEGENKNLLRIIQRSVDRMLKLVNQLMDFNKLENDTLMLKVKRIDIIEPLKYFVDIFKVNAENKGITLTTSGLVDNFIMWLDQDKLEKIFGNLMSNALKFTPIGGKIDISFDVVTREDASALFELSNKDVDSQYVKIIVTNTGENIPESKHDLIFKRYYQLSGKSEETKNWGTGIGLYYARSLTNLHHGYIKVMNPEDQDGASFVFILPVNDISYTKEERTSEQHTQLESFPLVDNILNSSNKSSDINDEMKTLLIVDDDTEVAFYIKTLLSTQYKVVCRFDAESALKTVREEAPDLILSDVVMAGKDGYQLCNEIKNDRLLCHIPVILITAKSTVENQVEGLNSGADAYVTKPFEPNYLLALIHSQLKNRENVRNILSKATQTDKIDENVLSPQDNEFMTELYQLMENELSNTDLDVSRMTEILKISRTKFYYKVKGLVGENPSSFFKTYKLNRAAELISEGKYTISEISDITGFSTLSHFSKSFKKHFGVAPTEYRR